MTLADIAQALETFGPWGVTAVLLFAIGYMYKSTGNLLERRNDQFVNALQDMTAAMNASAEQGRRLETQMDRTERQLQNTQAVLARVETELEIRRRLDEERRQ